MKFVVDRTSVWDDKTPPCEEAKRVELEYLDYRTAGTLDEARLPENKHWSDAWFKNGTNHRVDTERGMIVCDTNRKYTEWIIELNTLEDVLQFTKKHGEIIFCASDYKDYPMSIEIYDGYRE